MLWLRVLSQMWDIAAVLGIKLLCRRWGNAWLRQNWIAAAGPAAAVLFIGQVCKHREQSTCKAWTFLQSASYHLVHQIVVHMII